MALERGSCAIGRLPNELLAQVIELAAAYDLLRDGDPFVLASPTSVQVADKTRRSIMLALAMARITPEIRTGWKTSSSDFPMPYFTGSFNGPVRVSEHSPHLIKKTRTIVALLGWNSGSPEECRAGVQLCHLLSHLALKHFSTDLSFSVPWLSFLGMRSSQSLTHLDIHIPPTFISDTTIRQLNCFEYLVFLRMVDVGDLESDETAPSPENLKDLPRLSLPNLVEMQLVVKNFVSEGHPDGPIPFRIGEMADLPSLTRLRLHEDYTGDDTLQNLLKAHGEKLEVLHYTSGAIPTVYDFMSFSQLAPNLTEFGCHVSAYAEVINGHAPLIQHPRIQHLSISGLGWFTETLRLIDRKTLPSLLNIRLSNVVWADIRERDEFGTDRMQRKVLEEIEIAARLAMQGILVLDRVGKPFGDLESVVERRRKQKVELTDGVVTQQ
ncbi:hypothetical protein PUNSTDRAFT_133626 [Punctularia strigosozonata HHB-11173 SS5]|uniref:uncharacterized protein n=1 Tax=Punctularia strigosozonata (strain HHB-11173) TaxID=741275 RepID=UPI0004417A59|nr:uncharacterized protein PUNSTDRAFT_133626 [Punctularia strigosozonata HHB-11173 SS5]EIN09853.1 hypothetical protein PUNSTDRAFT_133626 [Punctularia strigosozonata HHB-11173 SS5]